MLPASRKDVLPAHQKSSVIYTYKCHCDSRYVGRIYQRLQDRIKQHVPKWLRQHTGSQRIQPDRASKEKRSTPECDSAIGHHLLDNDKRHANYNEDQFSILDTAQSRFHLTSLKASYIRVRRLNLCKQKSLFTLSRCSSRLQAIAPCPIKIRVTISHLIGERCIASRTFEIVDKCHSLL